jgi:hypothetical protein
MLTVPSSKVRDKALDYTLAFVPAVIGVFLEPGLLASSLIITLAFVLMILYGSYSVGRTKKNLPEKCSEVMEEYVEFYRRKVKEKE